VLFVVAAGNDAADNDSVGSYPCDYDLANIICVAATDNTDHLASFSNVGRRTVDIAAPGTSILSTIGGPAECGAYAWMSGTSMATPQVSGAAALVLAKHPDVVPADMRALLVSQGDPLPAADAARIGGGAGRRLDAGQALASFESSTPSTPTSASGTLYAPPRTDEPAAPASSCPSAPVKTSTPVVPAPVQTPAPRTPPAVTPSTPGGTGTAPTIDRTAPALTVTLPARLPLRTVLGKGLRVPAGCSERCAARVVVTVDGRTTKRLRIATRASTTTVATATALIARGSTMSLTARFTSRAKRALRRARAVRATVRVIATDAAGNARTRSRRVTLAR
jgi:hypothetical protein